LEPLKDGYSSLLLFGFLVYPRHLQLIQPSILLVLIGDISPDCFRIATYRIHEISTRPEGLARVVPVSLQVVTRNMYRTLALDVAHRTRHRQLRWHVQQHVNMIGHYVPFFDPTLLLLG